MASILIGIVLSFFIAGLGMVYAKKYERGTGIMLLWSISALIAVYSDGFISVIMGIFTFLLWTYSFVATFFSCIGS